MGKEDSSEVQKLGEGKVNKQSLAEQVMGQEPSVKRWSESLESDEPGEVLPGKIQVKMSLKSHGIAGENYGQEQNEGEVITSLSDLLNPRDAEPAIG